MLPTPPQSPVVTMLMGSGLLAKDGEDGVVVHGIMPHAIKIFGKDVIQEGDSFLKFGDKKIKSAASLGELYNAVEEGQMIEMVLSRDGKEFSVSFEKKAGQEPGKVMIRN